MCAGTPRARDQALLIAVDAGRCDLVPSGTPDLRVDGRWTCDQPRVHALVATGLMVRAASGGRGGWAAALLTDIGHAALGPAHSRSRPRRRYMCTLRVAT